MRVVPLCSLQLQSGRNDDLVIVCDEFVLMTAMPVRLGLIGFGVVLQLLLERIVLAFFIGKFSV